MKKKRLVIASIITIAFSLVLLTVFGVVIYNTIFNNNKYDEKKLNKVSDAYLDKYNFMQIPYDYQLHNTNYSTLEYELVNDTDAFLNANKLTLFYDDNQLINWLNFKEYFYLLEGRIHKEFTFLLEDEQQRALAIAVDYGEDSYEYVVFDFDDNELYFSYIDAMTDIFKLGSNQTKLDDELTKVFDASSGIEEVKSDSVLINFNDYHMQLDYDNGNYLVPTQLLTNLITAYDYHMFFTTDEFVYGDAFSNEGAMVDFTYKTIKVDYSDELIAYNNDFMRLFFDNFYGLKASKSGAINSFNNLNDANSYIEDFRNAILGLDDLHTSTMFFMYGNKDLLLTPKEFAYYNAYADGINSYTCSSKEHLSTVELNENTALLYVNTFEEEDFTTKYLKQLKTIESYDNIILDVSCNGGGYIGNAVAMLAPFVLDSLDVHSINLYGGENHAEYNKSDDYTIDANIYLVTSDYSYSAGNYVVAMFNDNEIGQIIGTPSGGGACAITIYTNPIGAVFTFSSANYILVDQAGNVVESGIAPDIAYEHNKQQYYDDLTKLVS